MVNETRNPQLGDRGYTIEESLEALRRLYPVSPSGVKCSGFGVSAPFVNFLVKRYPPAEVVTSGTKGVNHANP